MEATAKAKSSPTAHRTPVMRSIRVDGAPQPALGAVGAAIPHPRRFGFPWALLLALLMVAAVEVAVRCVDPKALLPRTSDVGEYQAAQIHIDLYGPADVALIGSSRVREGLHASQIQRRCEDLRRPDGASLRVVNYSCAGARTDVIYSIVSDLIKSPNKPRLIVVGLSPVELRGGGAAYELQALYWDFKDWYNQLRARGIQVASQTLPIILRHKIGEYYQTLRFRDGLAELIERPFVKSPVHFDDPLVNDVGLLQQQNPRRNLANRPIQRSQVRQLLKWTGGEKTFRFAGLKVQFLSHALLACRRAGVRVVVLEMPVPRIVKQTLPRGTYDTYLALVRKTAAAQHVPFVTLSQLHLSFGDIDFMDQSHLTKAGADKLTDAVTRSVIVPTLKHMQRPTTQP